MTAEGSTGAPLRQQIAEVIHSVDCRSVSNDDGHAWDHCPYDNYTVHADAVVALLNLTEEEALLDTRDDERLVFTGYGAKMTRHMAQREGCFVVTRYCTPWLPSTPPDTSSSETTTGG